MMDELLDKMVAHMDWYPDEYDPPDVRSLAENALEAISWEGLVIVNKDDLRAVVTIAEEADVYIDPRLEALDRLRAIVDANT